MSAAEAAALFNRFCQRLGSRQEFAWHRERMPHDVWMVSLTVPGVGFEARGQATSKKTAQEQAIAMFLQFLDTSGALESMGMSMNGTAGAGGGPRPAQPGMAAKPPGAAAGAAVQPPVPAQLAQLPAAEEAEYEESEPPTKKQAVGAWKPVALTKPVMVPVVKMLNGSPVSADACYQELLRLVRQALMEDALEVVHRLHGKPGCFSLKHLGTLLTNISVRSPRVPTMALLDTFHTLSLVPFPDPLCQKYYARHSKWIVGDLLADGDATVSRAQRVPANVLESRGECVASLEASRGKGGTDLWLSGRIAWGHQFQKGDWVFVTCLDTGLQVGDPRGTCEGELLTIAPVGMSVKIYGLTREELGVVIDKKVRVDKAANRVTFNRQVDALRAAVHLSGELAWLRVPLFGEEEDLNLFEDAKAEEKVCSSLRSNASSSQFLGRLNESQQKAIAACLARRLTLIQGPPGTGKTHTASKLVELLLATGISPILLTADSNIAVDNLVGAVAQTKKKIVRVGRPEMTRPELERFNLERQASGGDLWGGSQKNWGELTRILKQAEVVCTTCSGAAHPLVQEMAFRCVILDEATQATEPSSLVPLLRLHEEGVLVLVGDQQQLGPTVVCQEALEEGLGMSMFERLVSRGLRTMLLDTQYRMHPAIADFPSRYYYDCRLRTGITGVMRKALPDFPWPEPLAPVVFVPTEGKEMLDGTSFYNPAEADNVFALLQMLADSPGISSASNIGIISPYSAQVKYLKKRLSAAPPYKQPATGKVIEFGSIEVNSVDGFQGREKEIIMLSTVRCNTSGSVGFLADPRRLNVAITRARRGLIVCGDVATLSQDRGCWGGWLTWAMERGVISGVEAADANAAEALRSLHSLTVEELAVTEPT